MQERRDGTFLFRSARQRFKNSLLNILRQIGPEQKHSSPEHGFEDVHATPLGDEVPREREDRDTGQDQQGHRAGDAAIQTIASEMTAHGHHPLTRTLRLMVSGIDGSGAGGRACKHY